MHTYAGHFAAYTHLRVPGGSSMVFGHLCTHMRADFYDIIGTVSLNAGW